MPIDPIEAHRGQIAELSRRHAAGELAREQFLAESAPHARVVAALERDAERDAVIALVKAGLAHPAIVEAVAVGVAHYFRRLSADRPAGELRP